ncbi:MAG: hypothetical protein O3C43_17800 [Verrucomicrobia bacterium]|nr:hypothetical protein [Verrucomicrobiota bacterium]MDA1068346.1 hypothetical protein [Verrucomicrobiota bacterium]
MLFIFRKLRRSFFQPGKVRTYVAYALGEIALIVIGILIAVEISDRNQVRKDRAEEQQLLAAISDEVSQYIFYVETGIQRGEEIKAASERLMMAMKNPSITADTAQLDQDISDVLSIRWLSGAGQTTSIYDVLAQGGQLRLISSKDLQKQLKRLKTNFGYLLNYELLQASFVDNQLSPFLNKYINRLALTGEALEVDPALYDSPFTTDREALLKSREFSNLLTELIKHTRSLLNSNRRLYDSLNQIDTLVIEGNPSLEPHTFERVDYLP